jgi:cell division protein FtsN
VQGSVEAIVTALNRISTDLIKVRVLSAGVGGITESDVLLAAASGAASAALPATTSSTPTGLPGLPAKVEVKPAASADPLGDLAKARTAPATPAAAAATGAVAEPFSYFVQVGAFRTPEDAESQRARLSLAGIETRVSEREQSGRTVYRVRVGPFDKREEADRAKEKLDASGLETALVRVQR